MSIPSIHIEGYRGLKQLKIPQLASVNLIVGKNSVGKSTLLEALALYFTQGNPRLLLSFLENRQEMPYRDPFEQFRNEAVRQQAREGLQNLFYGRPKLNHGHLTLTIRANDALQIEISPSNNISPLPQVAISWNVPGTPQSIDTLLEHPRAFLQNQPTPAVIYVPATGLMPSDIANYWNEITLTPLEDEVIKALNFVVPHITRLSFLDTATNKIPIVLHQDERVALGSLGEGLQRMLGLALALTNAKDGYFIIDEIGTGLHYTVQTQMWEFLMRTAEELNVQVFATTHSSDCVRAFQYVSNELENVDGQLIRLEKWGDEVTAIVIDEEMMEHALEYGLEVR